MASSNKYKTFTIWKIRGTNSWKLISNSSFIRSDKLWAKYHFKTDDSPLELGFVVSRKYSNAVKRNRLKRRVKNSVIELLQGDLFPNNLVLLIGTNNRNSEELTYAEIKNSLEYIAENVTLNE